MDKYRKQMNDYRDYEKKSSSELIEELITRARAPYSDENSWALAIISVVLERRCDHG